MSGLWRSFHFSCFCSFSSCFSQSVNALASEKPLWAEKLNKTERERASKQASESQRPPLCFLIAFTDVKHQPLTPSSLLAPDAF